LQQGWLREKNGVAPQILCNTRWNSQVKCLETYKENYKLYLEIHEEHMDEMPVGIGKIIDNVALYREASNLHSQLQILEKALNKVQHD